MARYVANRLMQAIMLLVIIFLRRGVVGRWFLSRIRDLLRDVLPEDRSQSENPSDKN